MTPFRLTIPRNGVVSSRSQTVPGRRYYSAKRLRPAWTAQARASGAQDPEQPLAGELTQAQLKERLQELTAKLNQAEQTIQSQEERQQALAPFRVSAPKSGIVGNSRYARQLRQQVVAAARRDRRPVLIFGEPGLRKLNIAALIHFGSPNGRAPLVAIDCGRLDENASELLGRGAKRGLLSWLPPEGSIILHNVHEAPPAVLPLLQREVATASLASSMDEEGAEGADSIGTGLAGKVEAHHPSLLLPRFIMTAATRVPALETYAQMIKVPPLRVRKQDIGDLARYFLRTLARERGVGPLSLTPAALRRLEAGSYPNNEAELQAAVERAVAQSTQEAAAADVSSAPARQQHSGGATVIGEEVFWFASQHKDRLRLDLLRSLPLLRNFLRSDIWPERINFGFTVYAFAAIVAVLFLGPQDRAHNFALNVFWCDWWALSFVVFPFLGRIWCSVCPFMIYGELVQRWRLATGAHLLKWPREAMQEWGPWFLFSLFAAILVWEEVWDLPQNAALSSWLLLLITAGAMIGSFFFERRIWCRYLCPIGGMNGLFAKLSMTELRARQGVCSAECDTYHCYKGGPAEPPEGLETMGCPVYSHPAQLTSNRDCVLCMTCLKACPHSSVEFRLRIPGADLWNSSHEPIPAEVCLMFMLLGAVPLHHLPQLRAAFGIDSAAVADKGPHILVSLLLLAAPGVLAWGADAAWRAVAAVTRPATNYAVQPAMAAALSSSGAPAADLTSPESKAVAVMQGAAVGYSALQSGSHVVAPIKPFLELSYGYLPLVWAATLAHYEALLLTEAGRVLPAAASTFGVEAPWLPTLSAHPAVVSFVQGGTLVAGVALSLGMTRRIGAQPWRVLLPQCILIVAFTAVLWPVIVDY